MALLAVTRHPTGPRCWVAGQRLHHGATGCLLAAVAAARGRRAILALALALVVHDRHDWRVWFAREHKDSAGPLALTAHRV